MSTAAAAPPADADASAPVPAKKGKKKLIIIAGAVALLLVVAGGGTAYYLKKKAAHAAEAVADEAGMAAEQHSKPDLKHPPTFLPLDPFVVNLADREADRYAQVGITFEVEDAKFAEQMKAFMPAIRNGILMILAQKASRDLLDRSGKEQLAAEILRDSARTMGLDIDEPPVEIKKMAVPEAPKTDGDDDAKPVAAKPPKKVMEPIPIRRVHFSNFVIQ